MKFGMLIDDHRIEIAVLEAVAQRGIGKDALAAVLNTLGWSRATFYRQFGGWEPMMQSVYEDALGVIDGYFPIPQGDRRAQFEAWWATLVKLFASPRGRALVRMRSVAMVERDNLEEFEMARLKSLREWIGRKSNAIAKATWLLALLAGGAKTESEALELREMAWAPLAVDLQPTEDEDRLDVSLLAAPLGGR